jgi:FixJ family two-component response regulator
MSKLRLPRASATADGAGAVGGGPAVRTCGGPRVEAGGAADVRTIQDRLGAGRPGFRERTVFECLHRGKPNKVIAHELQLVEATVKCHVANILKKMKVTNRTAAALGPDP